MQAYFDVLASYALELKGEGAVTDPSFVPSEEMLRALRERLRERDTSISDGAWDGATDRINRQLRRFVVRYVFGRDVSAGGNRTGLGRPLAKRFGPISANAKQNQT